MLSLNGAAGDNTLNYDAGGKIPTITSGLLPGEVLISIAGAGTVDAINYQQVNFTDLPPIVITPEQRWRSMASRTCRWSTRSSPPSLHRL